MTESTLQQRILDAIPKKQSLKITAGNSKSFYGNPVAGTPLDVSMHRGIISYEPTELVITAKCGTPLQEIQAALVAHQQMLVFEPPAFGGKATIGGTIACGLSGPRRPFAGSLRDSVLGIKIINGKGQIMSFGGQVMKNVAGYDLSRLIAGSLGTLGVILEVSLKVLPMPLYEETRCLKLSENVALKTMNALAGQSPQLSACVFYKDALYCRLSGMKEGVVSAANKLGGETLVQPIQFWQGIKEQQHPFFEDRPLWRISVPSNAPSLPILGTCLIDWGGALRWHVTAMKQEEVWAIAKQHNGQATLFKRGDCSGTSFQPLSPAMHQLQQRIKNAFDPLHLFNSGKIYAGL